LHTRALRQEGRTMARRPPSWIRAVALTED
jgi:hypothetical protein